MLSAMSAVQLPTSVGKWFAIVSFFRFILNGVLLVEFVYIFPPAYWDVFVW